MSPRSRFVAGSLAGAIGVALVLAGGSAQAGLFKRREATAAPGASFDVGTKEIQRALDESRLLDAGRMLDEARLAGVKDPRLNLLSGQLSLKRDRYDVALEAFKAAEATPTLRPAALEGEGIALSMLQRSDEALATLQEAVAADATAWRAWNALGGEWDKRREWPRAEEAYTHALKLSRDAAPALNNRGYSRMLQGRLDEAVIDFVAALRKDPALAPARTNLRLAMAMRGEYDQAMAGAGSDNPSAALNNAGFAAMMRGEYDRAIDLFEKSMESKGEFYARASANLQVARSLKAQGLKNPTQ
jgi:Flp pilus assembly protein TadD